MRNFRFSDICCSKHARHLNVFKDFVCFPKPFQSKALVRIIHANQKAMAKANVIKQECIPVGRYVRCSGRLGGGGVSPK